MKARSKWAGTQKLEKWAHNGTQKLEKWAHNGTQKSVKWAYNGTQKLEKWAHARAVHLVPKVQQRVRSG